MLHRPPSGVDLVKRRPILYVLALDLLLWAVIVAGVVLIWKHI
jgi:hypothetical protein